MRYTYVLLCIFILFGCSQIQNYRFLQQPENRVLEASIGSTIFRLNRTADLPNAFGKADLYGGKVDKGYTELKLKGFSEKGILILQVTDINHNTSETTMDRYRPAVSVNVKQKFNTSSANENDPTTFLFDTAKEISLTIAGIRVVFIKIGSYGISYKLHDVYK